MIEWTVYFTAILPLLYGACNIRALSPSIKHVYPCSMLLSFVSWWQWSIVLFYVYAEGGELSWRGLCRHRWHWGCRFHNLRCRRWRQGRRRGGSLVSVSVFIVYYMYIDLISRWLALITNKSYCFLFLVSTLNKDFLSYLLILLVQIMAPTRRQAIIWTNDWLYFWRIYASLGLNGLMQKRRNSSAPGMGNVVYASSHRYDDHLIKLRWARVY